MTPLISILIATKNRQKYCLSAVESILNLTDDRIQVIVQDNSDDKSLETMILPFMGDSRLIYRYTPPPFSSIDNFKHMLSPEVNKPVFKKFKCFIDFLPILIRIFRRPIEVIRIKFKAFNHLAKNFLH